MIKFKNQLDIYIDESGNFDNYSKSNLIYTVSFILVDSCNSRLNDRQLNLFKNKLSKIIAGNHFVHVGNLVRGEKPYKGVLIKERQSLFYLLFLLAKYSRYKVTCSVIEKKITDNDIQNRIKGSVSNTIKDLSSYLSNYSTIIVHYDNGQSFIKNVLDESFSLLPNNILIVKTLQQENPFMQVADLYCYLELIKYKITRGLLSKHETNFFGQSRKIKKNYLKQLEDKFI